VADVEIRPVRSDGDLETFARIFETVLPEGGVDLEDLRWSDRTYPGGARYIGLLDGRPVGAAGVGRVYVYGPEYAGFWSHGAVLAEARRHGVGGSLYRAVSEHARSSAKEFLLAMATDDQLEAIEFLVHRGFEVHERMKSVRLELAGLEPPEVGAPDGVEITTLEARPDLGPATYEVALEALPDIPGDGPVAPGSLREYLARDVDKPSIPQWGFAVAVETVSGRVVGYASLSIPGGSPWLAWHHMTAVARSWRGRGLATALKRATIRAAIAHGLAAVEGQNDVDNTAMRAINRRLGYLPRPDEIIFRGPLAPAPAVASR
jgi:GNAT superfamily N-acetyltransferase